MDNVLQTGIDEEKFWNMTLGEVDRHLKAFNELQKQKAKERAQFDYILADLIGASVGRVIDKHCKLPSIEKVYPELFRQSEEELAKKQDEISAKNFKMFALAHNKKMEAN